MTAVELLENLNLLDEHERVEAKRASEPGKSVLETVCAFANEPGLGGGWAVLGVVREELALFPAYEVEGIAQPDKIASDLASQCRDIFNIPIRVDITTENIQGKNVVVVFVPEAQPQDKPVFFKAQGLPRDAFRRIGSTDQRCTDEDLAVFYQGRQQDSFDAGIVADATLDDLSPEAIADYRKSRADATPDAEELRWSDEELLQSLGALRRDAKYEWKPTVAGVILFGKPSALRRCFPMTRVDYIRVPGREWVPDPDRRFDTVELRDPLFRLIRRAQAAVLDDLPKRFGLDEGELQRQDTPVIPLRVIREALVNALMHRSYRSHSPVQIIRYANRLEIRNPGFSLKSPEHLGEPGSQPRNPKIAAVLHETLSDEEAKALILVREAGAIDNATYRDLSKVAPLAASQALRRLRDAGLLAQKGRGSATYYVPTERLVVEEALSSNLEVLSSNPAEDLSSNPSSLSSNPPALSSNPQFASDELAGLPTRFDEELRNSLLDSLPGSLAARLGAINTILRRKFVSWWWLCVLCGTGLWRSLPHFCAATPRSCARTICAP